jgi:hypothetical protein
MTSSTSKYDTFRRLLEATPHAIVHVAIGGVDGDLTSMQSPNDPIFWLHHSFIDKIWYDWQVLSNTPTAYDGRHLGVKVSSFDYLPPWNHTVEDTFNISALCYTYQAFSKRTSPEGLESPVPVGQERGKEFKLPQRIPESWVKMNGMSVQEFRQAEVEMRQIMIEVNNQTTGAKSDNSKASSVATNILLLIATVAASFMIQ